MTGLLLDTTALAWVLADSPRLGTTARGLVRSGPVWYSPVSVTEIEAARLAGRLAVPGDVPAAVASTGARELPYRAIHAAHLVDDDRVPDPFRRMVLAQADAEGLGLLTADPTLLALGEDRVVDATG